MNSLTGASRGSVAPATPSTKPTKTMIQVYSLAVILVTTSAYEISPRPNRIRFPSNEPPPQNYYGPHIFGAESQDAPLIRAAPFNMFNVLPQIPSHSKPFGEENKKGFSQGLIYNGGAQEDFYHPVPPMYENMKNLNKYQNSFNAQKRLPERHRFSPQRFNMPGKPFGHTPQKLFNPVPEKPENFNHEFMEVLHNFNRPNLNHEQRYEENMENYKKPVHSRPHIMIQKPIFKQNYEEDYGEDYENYERKPEFNREKVQKYKIESNIQEPNYFRMSEHDEIMKEQKMSGEWIPINAPEGALPAKSYEIQAPDLSVRYQNEDYDERPQKSRLRPQKRPSNVVYGGRKKLGNEEVVSASVMVKQ